MGTSTVVILALGCIPAAWGAFWWIWDWTTRPASWDIELPLAVASVELGLAVVAVALLKFMLIDRRF